MVRFRVLVVGVVVLSCLTACGFDGPIAVSAPQCVNVRGDVGSAGDEVVVAVTADACHGVDGRLLSEARSFDTLGRSVWHAPGLPIDAMVLTIGRSADRPLGDQPRNLPLTSQQATRQWGAHPVAPTAQVQRSLVRFVRNAALIAAALIAFVLGGALFVALVGCLRRGEIVLIWFLR